MDIDDIKFPIVIQQKTIEAYGMGFNKSLIMEVTIDRYSESLVNWLVYSHNVLIINTRMLSVAIDSYNGVKHV